MILTCCYDFSCLDFGIGGAVIHCGICRRICSDSIRPFLQIIECDVLGVVEQTADIDTLGDPIEARVTVARPVTAPRVLYLPVAGPVARQEDRVVGVIVALHTTVVQACSAELVVAEYTLGRY